MLPRQPDDAAGVLVDGAFERREVPMKSAIAGYACALFSFVVCDLIWLGLMVPRFYRPTLGDIVSSGMNLPPAVVFYLLYPIGLFIFAISPAVKSGSLSTALIYGALFGFFTYAT